MMRTLPAIQDVPARGAAFAVTLRRESRNDFVGGIFRFRP